MGGKGNAKPLPAPCHYRVQNFVLVCDDEQTAKDVLSSDSGGMHFFTPT